MSNGRDTIIQTGSFLVVCAIAVCGMSFAACILIQSGLLGNVPQIFGFIAYFGGPLPIVPAIIGLPGIVLLGVAAIMRSPRH